MASFESRGPRKLAGLNGAAGPAPAGLMEMLQGASMQPEGSFEPGAEFDVARNLSDDKLRGMLPSRTPTTMGGRYRLGTDVRMAGGDEEDMDAAFEMADPGMQAYNAAREQEAVEAEQKRQTSGRAKLLYKMQAKGMSKKEMNRVLEGYGLETLGWFD